MQLSGLLTGKQQDGSLLTGNILVPGMQTPRIGSGSKRWITSLRQGHMTWRWRLLGRSILATSDRCCLVSMISLSNDRNEARSSLLVLQQVSGWHLGAIECPWWCLSIKTVSSSLLFNIPERVLGNSAPIQLISARKRVTTRA